MAAISCHHCGVLTERTASAINHARRSGTNLYCSKSCAGVGRRRTHAPGWHAVRFVQDADKVAVNCIECERPMWLPASKVSMYKRCGKACADANRARMRELKRRHCTTCAKPFYPRPNQIRAGGGLFCSQLCNMSGREALSRPEVAKLAIARLAQVRAAGGVKHKSGPDNPSWRGGRAGYRKRMVESGQSAKWIRDYRKKNPHKVKEFSQKRYSRKIGSLPRGTVAAKGAAQKWRCAICRTSVKRGYHVDHIMPLARGGGHVPSNIQLLCATCNVRKSSKDPITYMQSLGRLL